MPGGRKEIAPQEFVDNVKICEPLGCSDHNQIHFIIKVKGERNRKTRYRKTFHKGRYKDMREYLAKTDWNNTLKNKTATECWNILKSEIDCVVDKFVPLKKQGKRSKKKHLSKEAISSRNKSENYRPVSLTSVICKLLERLIKDHLVDFLVKNKLINPSQHGRLKARSCLTNMLCFFGRCHKVGR